MISITFLNHWRLLILTSVTWLLSIFLLANLIFNLKSELQFLDFVDFIIFRVITRRVRLNMFRINFIDDLQVLRLLCYLLDVLHQFRGSLGEDIDVFLIEVLEQNLLGVLIDRGDSFNDCFHSIYGLSLEVLDLHLQDLCFLKGNFILSILDVLSVESKRDLIITEVLLHCEVLIRHFVLCQSGLFQGQ